VSIYTLLAFRPSAAECGPRLEQLVVVAREGVPLALQPSAALGAFELSAPVSAGWLRVAVTVDSGCRLRVRTLPQLRAMGDDEAGDEGALDTPRVLFDRVTGPWQPPTLVSWRVRPGPNQLLLELLPDREGGRDDDSSDGGRSDGGDGGASGGGDGGASDGGEDGAGVVRRYSISARALVGTPPLHSAGSGGRGARGRGRRIVRWLLYALAACVLLPLLAVVCLFIARRCAFALAAGWAHGHRTGEQLAERAKARPRAREQGDRSDEQRPQSEEHEIREPAGRASANSVRIGRWSAMT
jgi:hypothetical protein